MKDKFIVDEKGNKIIMSKNYAIINGIFYPYIKKTRTNLITKTK